MGTLLTIWNYFSKAENGDKKPLPAQAGKRQFRVPGGRLRPENVTSSLWRALPPQASRIRRLLNTVGQKWNRFFRVISV